MVRRFAERGTHPRLTAWLHLGSLAALALVVTGVSVFLVVSLLPIRASAHMHDACAQGSYCLYGLPTWAHLAVWSLAAAALLWLVVTMGSTVLAAVLASRRLRRSVVARGDLLDVSGPVDVYEVADDSVFALTFGIRRPLILLSRGLRTRLGQKELAVVLAHEEAHVRGRDTLLLLLSRATGRAVSLLPGMRSLPLHVERLLDLAADERACEVMGDRLLVASCVERVARLKFESARGGPLPIGAGCLTFAGEGSVAERVVCLVEGRNPAKARRRLLCAAVAIALALLLVGSGASSLLAGSLLSHPQAVVACLSPSHE